MKRRGAIITVAAVVAVAGVAAWYYRGIVRSQRELTDRINAKHDSIGRLDARLAGRGAVRDRLDAVARTTLGSDQETVDATLRSALNQILDKSGLAEPVVAARSAQAVRNPAAMTRAGELRGVSGREAVSFAEISATVEGSGTLEQVLRTLATIQSQVWAHRVDFFSIKPANKERTRFDLQVGLTTIYLPGWKVQPQDSAQREAVWTPLTEADFARWRPIVEKNVFCPLPPAVVSAPPPEPESSTTPPPPPPPPPPPYDKWKVTAIVVGSSGVELWVKNANSNQEKTLHVGDKVLDAEFVGGGGESARIRIGDDLYEVSLGRTLADRTAVTQ